MKKTRVILPLLCLLILSSCNLLHDDQLVARVGSSKLYRSQVVKFIPGGLSPEDSAALAHQYINSWAGEIILNEMASMQLSKREKDVSKELEDYRNSLLKYRYEQHYIEDRLDTLVTEEQIEEQYESNLGLYTLSVPIVQARYIRFFADSPQREDLMGLLCSDSPEDLAALDSLSYNGAQKFIDYGNRWIDMVTLSREFGMDYGTLLAEREGAVIDIVDEQKTEHVAYLREFIPSGKSAPLEYCSDNIKDAIIATRKYRLSSGLEQELLDDARQKGKFEIYDSEEN